MKNEEVGTRNDEVKASCLYFIVPRSYFLVFLKGVAER
jgi:hypothetical protein